MIVQMYTQIATTPCPHDNHNATSSSNENIKCTRQEAVVSTVSTISTTAQNDTSSQLQCERCQGVGCRHFVAVNVAVLGILVGDAASIEAPVGLPRDVHRYQS